MIFPEGALYYGEIRRRENPLTEALRQEVKNNSGGNASAVSAPLYAKGAARQVLQCLLSQGTVFAKADEKRNRLGNICGNIWRVAMRHFLNTLFVTTENAYLTLDGKTWW